MNLELEPAQRLLAEAVSLAMDKSAASVSGWEVLDSAGLTESLMSAAGEEGSLGLLDWCLIFEELGTGCRDIALLRAVRTFLDVFVDNGGEVEAKDAAEAFRSWAGTWQFSAEEQRLAVRREESGGRDGTVTWYATGITPGALAVSVRDPAEAEAYVDRDLLACAAYAIGVGRRSLEAAQARASERIIGGHRLLERQGTSHRLAQSAVDLALARVAVWRAADAAGQGDADPYQAPAAVATSVSVVLGCAHNAVQTFGALGTSDPTITRLYGTAYEVASICGAPSALWRSAGVRWLNRAVSAS
jgi:hypothetical protein